MVKVYKVMHPRRHLKDVARISKIQPMHGNKQHMLWFDKFPGAWHPDACEVMQ